MTDTLFSAYQDQANSLLGSIPALDGLRTKAAARARELGLPSPRQEAWRYSDIRALKKEPFALSPRTDPAPDLTRPLLGERSARIVFVNGRYSENHSDLGTLVDVAGVRTLTNHCMADDGRKADLREGEDAVSCLNTALMRDGIVISIPAGTIVREPVELINISTGGDREASHSRHMIEIGEGASLTLVERFVGGAGHYWSNPAIQVRVSEKATFDHIRLQEEGTDAVHTGRLYAVVGDEATFVCTSLLAGGKLSRFEVDVRMLGMGGHAVVNGAALAGTGQSHDTLTTVSHTVPGATSDQIYRTIADKRGRSSFAGKIIVAPDAQGTEADQSFKALLLDRTGEANAKPELEIFADDVKCSHGATVGEIDKNALFYMMSRGIDPATAQQILVEAFTADALVAVEGAGLRDTLVDLISNWMRARHTEAL